MAVGSCLDFFIGAGILRRKLRQSILSAELVKSAVLNPGLEGGRWIGTLMMYFGCVGEIRFLTGVNFPQHV